jgi:hypothetical protein
VQAVALGVIEAVKVAAVAGARSRVLAAGRPLP